MRPNEDDVQTAPIACGSHLHVEQEILEIDVLESGEIVFCPDVALVRPVLKIWCRGSEVLVQDIFSGDRALARHGHWPVECFRDGHQLETSVSRELPLKIIVFNEGPEKTVVSSSLSAGRTP